MKKVVRLTESDLVRLVKRVISEQGIPEGYIEKTPVGYVPKMIEKYGDDFKYYVNDKKNISFISNGTKLVFVQAPEDEYMDFEKLRAKYGFGPYNLQDVTKYL